MHSRAVVAEVLEIRRREGLGAGRIAARTGLPVATVKDWLAGRLPRHARDVGSDEPRACGRCGGEAHRFDELPSEYVYLLGLYLGDGCISEHARGVHKLRIFLDLKYPRIVDECVDAMCAVLPTNRVQQVERGGSYARSEARSNVEASVYSKTLPCLFPQHGPGKKHERPIVLSGWQRDLAARWPELLLRGLIHSDGCRFINTGTNWRSPRYCFRNYSDDIRRIFCDACDAVGVRYTFAPNTVYVSRVADVARLDEFIGPKA